MIASRPTAGKNQIPSRSSDIASSVDDQPPAQDKFSFLKEHTTTHGYRGKDSFYQHLSNVYHYLKSQSLPDEVCDAGLFHSVYGTEFYDFQDAAVSRDVVRGYIGEYAEELVHIFCGLRKDRFGSIVANAPGCSARQHLDLCRVEYANSWDAKENRDVTEQLEVLSQTIARLERQK